jgi:hypothetical protein
MLQRFFDFLGLAGTVDEQAQGFITLAKQNPDWATKAIIKFLPTDKLENNTMSQSTIANYLKPIKLLCEVSEVAEMHSKCKKISRFVRRAPKGTEIIETRTFFFSLLLFCLLAAKDCDSTILFWCVCIFLYAPLGEIFSEFKSVHI